MIESCRSALLIVAMVRPDQLGCNSVDGLPADDQEGSSLCDAAGCEVCAGFRTQKRVRICKARQHSITVFSLRYAGFALPFLYPVHNVNRQGIGWVNWLQTLVAQQ